MARTQLLKATRKDDEGFWLIPCPKIEYAGVPVYNCAGSFVKGKWICDFVQSASMGLDSAEVECLWPNPRNATSSQRCISTKEEKP